MRSRQRDILGAALAICGATFVGVLILVGRAPGIWWRVGFGVVVLVEIADNLSVHMTRRAIAAVLPPEDEEER